MPEEKGQKAPERAIETTESAAARRSEKLSENIDARRVFQPVYQIGSTPATSPTNGEVGEAPNASVVTPKSGDGGQKSDKK